MFAFFENVVLINLFILSCTGAPSLDKNEVLSKSTKSTTEQQVQEGIFPASKKFEDFPNTVDKDTRPLRKGESSGEPESPERNSIKADSQLEEQGASGSEIQKVDSSNSGEILNDENGCHCGYEYSCIC